MISKKKKNNKKKNTINDKNKNQINQQTKTSKHKQNKTNKSKICEEKRRRKERKQYTKYMTRTIGTRVLGEAVANVTSTAEHGK